MNKLFKILLTFFDFLRFSAVPLFCLAGCLFTHHLQSQWVQQTLPVSKPITGIKFVDSLKGWACTNRGTPADTGYILYTSNGGANWLVQFKRNNFAFSDIVILNSQTGYAGGFLSGPGLPGLYKTVNGGINWDSIPINVNHNISDIYFLNNDSGWTCSDLIGPDVRTTTDGGNTWIVRTNGMSQPSSKIFFLDNNTGFCGASNILYKTTNAGLNWSLLYSSPEAVISIFFLNEVTGWLGLNNNKIHFTSNAGINWSNQQVPLVNSQPIYDIFFINSMTGWAGRTSNIYLTTNGGVSWGYQIVTTGTQRISFINSTTGWGGLFGISKTTNGGGPVFYLGFTPAGTNIPKNFTLYQNYPNPFNPYTTIKLDISESSVIKLYISDILGRELHKEEAHLKPGSYEFKWDAVDYSSGTYFYRLTTEKYTETKKMILIK